MKISSVFSPRVLLFHALLAFTAPVSLTFGAEPTDAKPPASTPAQIPLCMIGDSITWAMEGDHWRANLLRRLPRLSFIGTHSAKLGYSHAGEGGNNTGQVLARLEAIPPSQNYALLIGTNDTSVSSEAEVPARVLQTADRITAIVTGLMHKPGTKKVFLGSILPCTSDSPAKPGNPFRDSTNAATNVLLRQRISEGFGKGTVVWVKYEKALRALPDWPTTIRLHPTVQGYHLLGDLLAEAIIKEFAVPDPTSAPTPSPSTGVRVENLFDPSTGTTRAPLIAGWYTVSFDVLETTAPAPSVILHGLKSEFSHTHPLQPANTGTRISYELFTNYEGYGYTRDQLQLGANGCRIEHVLLEKRRPSAKASTYGEGNYLDTQTPPSPGELLELAPK